MPGQDERWGSEPSVLIFGDRPQDRAMALAAAASVGARVIGAGPIDAALERLGQQVSVDSVLIELDGNTGPMRDRLLD